MIELTNIELLQGLLSLIFCILSALLGIKMGFKSKEHHNKIFLWAGISWTLSVSAYWCDAINFILIITIGIQLNNSIYMYIGSGGLLVFALILWTHVTGNLLWEKKANKITGICALGQLSFEILLIFLVFTNPSQIGTQITPFYAEWSLFITLYLISAIILFDSLGILFIKQSLKTDNQEIKLKAKFLALAFISFTIGTMMDSIGGLTEITVVIARIFVITGSICFYIGFILPEFIKKKLLKN